MCRIYLIIKHMDNRTEAHLKNILMLLFPTTHTVKKQCDMSFTSL